MTTMKIITTTSTMSVMASARRNRLCPLRRQPGSRHANCSSRFFDVDEHPSRHLCLLPKHQRCSLAFLVLCSVKTFYNPCNVDTCKVEEVSCVDACRVGGFEMTEEEAEETAPRGSPDADEWASLDASSANRNSSTASK